MRARRGRARPWPGRRRAPARRPRSRHAAAIASIGARAPVTRSTTLSATARVRSPTRSGISAAEPASRSVTSRRFTNGATQPSNSWSGTITSSPGRQVEPRGDQTRPFARAREQAHVLRSAVEQSRRLFPDRLEQRRPAQPGRALRGLCFERFASRPGHGWRGSGPNVAKSRYATRWVIGSSMPTERLDGVVGQRRHRCHTVNDVQRPCPHPRRRRPRRRRRAQLPAREARPQGAARTAATAAPGAPSCSSPTLSSATCPPSARAA